ncbi:unnamed protein product [Calicophoron daubneyi]|uniref:Uncharacterized protein n=2 Tax=Calicophoron daubneyi TaxID=300641 RepID=A0AAV2TXA2_CALDB
MLLSSSGGSRNCGCQASFAVRRGDEGLMVTNKYMVHNHAVSLTEFKAHPRNRKLSEDQRRDAGLLLKYGCPNSALRTMSRLEYGTDLTSYDVSNLRSGSVRTRPKRQRLDQEDGADLSSNEEGASSSHPSETTQRSGSSAHKPHICGVCSIADDRRMVTCEHCSWVVHFACSLVLGNGKQCKQCGNDIKLMPQRKLRRRFSNPRIPQARCTLRRVSSCFGDYLLGLKRRLVPEQALNELPQEALEGSDVYDDDSSNAEYGERSLVELKRELKEEEDGNPDCAPILRSILKDMD